MIFPQNQINIGVVKQETSHQVRFPFIAEGSVIRQIITTCGCSSAYVDNAAQEVVVTYSAGKVPPQVLSNGKTAYTATKGIEVTFDEPDGTQRMLTIHFTATVTL